MSSFLIKQAPALQILIPLFAAIINTILFRLDIGNLIIRIVSIILLCLNCILFFNHDFCNSLYYHFSNFPAPIGISYKIEQINLYLICFSNILLLLFSFCLKDSIEKNILNFIKSKYSNLFYSVILLLHTGTSGILSSSDLFHLYVCLEIISLSCCTLISQGKDKEHINAALDYLIIGSIGAVFILLSIGFILYFSGSLSIEHIKIAKDHKIFSITISLFLVGSLMKVALFPLNFAIFKIYYRTNPIILSYIAPVSSIVGFYILYLVYYKIFTLSTGYHNISILLTICASSTIVIFSIIASIGNNFRTLLISSAAANVGYMIFIFLLPEKICNKILPPYLIADGFSKFALFILLNNTDSTLDLLGAVGRKYKLLGAALVVIIFSNSGLPLTIGFVNKFTLITELISHHYIIPVIVISLVSIISLKYHFKILYNLYSYKEKIVDINQYVPIIITAFLMTLLLI